MPLRGTFAETIEQCGNTEVRHLSRQGGDELFSAHVGLPAVFAGLVFGHGQCRMIAALPVQDQLNLPVLHAHEDLVERGPQDALARLRACIGVVPGLLQISAQRQ